MKATKSIRLLTVQFDLPLKFHEISQFRGAVIKTTKGKNNLFHNHSPDGMIYRYPLIQYKSINKKAALLCIEEGVEGMQDFFASTDWKLNIGSGSQPVKVENLNVRQHRIGVWDKSFNYKLTRWLPLNQENYKKYHELPGLAEQIQLLEKILLANLLSFLQGIDLYVDEKIEVKITQLLRQKLEKYKGQEMQSFSIRFSSNISLPNNIGLGKGSSSGFGMVRENTQEKQENN
ncbi:MAG: CRISPR-associated endonuclease Cas6 [Bacteroidales bacterium]|jgi:hypothetical protein|nr:CRISPR-associated endonuclease Cas6 [Bacteroidales bacterium]